jgi:hypothetical protein
MNLPPQDNFIFALLIMQVADKMQRWLPWAVPSWHTSVPHRLEQRT